MKAQFGMGVVFGAMVLMVATLLVGIAVDVAYIYTHQANLQTAADAGALAGSLALSRSTASTSSGVLTDARTEAKTVAETHSHEANPIVVNAGSDISFGFIVPATLPAINEETFSTPSDDLAFAFSGGYNAVRIAVNRLDGSGAGQVPAIFGKLLGFNGYDVGARATAMLDNRITAFSSGLRPFYACNGQFEVAKSTGAPEQQAIRIYGEHQMVNGVQLDSCPDSPNGNWGFADFRDSGAGAPGNDTLARWIQDGYGGEPGEKPVESDEYYSVEPGNAIGSNEVRTAIQSLIDNHTIIPIPLIDEAHLEGSNVRAHVTDFVGFVITDFKWNGPESGRYIDGYFTDMVCSEGCSLSPDNGAQGGNIFKLRLVK